MRRVVLTFVLIGFAVVSATCGSESPTQPPPVTTTTTTLATQPSPSPTPQATPTPSAQSCNLQPGPVARLAISPREQRTDGSTTDIRVRARSGWDEVWCLDKSKSHRLDFNANQRNEAGRECCYEGDATWKVTDGNGIVQGQSSRHEDNLIWRLNVEPNGRSTSFFIEAELDGAKSYPWQSGSGYRQGPLQIVTMSAADILKECTCIYKGNGVYEGGDACPKI